MDVKSKIRKLNEHMDRFWKLEDENRPNNWRIVEYGNDSYEIRYSKYLRWLLDPGESHNVRDFFVSELWAALEKKAGIQLSGKKTKWSDKTESDCEVFYEELPDEKRKTPQRRFIDVLVYDKSHNRYLCIELKVTSDIHTNQLESYSEFLKTEDPYAKANGLLAFITPDGYKPDCGQWDPSWVCFSYYELYEVLSCVAQLIDKENKDFRPDRKKLVLDFRDDLFYVYGKFCCPKLAKEICRELTDEQQIRDEVINLNLISGDNERLIEYILRNRQGNDTTKSIVGQKLIRRLFNDLATDKSIDLEDTDNFINHNEDERTSDNVRQDVFKNGNPVKVRVTNRNRGKAGQGLNLFFENCEVYLSVGNASGLVLFPNDGVQFRRKKGDKGEKVPYKSKEAQKVYDNYEDEKKKLFKSIDDFLPVFLSNQNNNPSGNI
jgi:hypothetical protein